MKIIDFGSGNTCKNDKLTILTMIGKICGIDKEQKSILKFQLFEKAGDNIPLDRKMFDYAYWMASECGFQTTASVFDESSLKFLLEYEVPFIKIANNPKYYYLKDLIRSARPVLPIAISWNDNQPKGNNLIPLCCVSKYPSEISDYEDCFNPVDLQKGISDHTTNWSLYRKYKPEIYECHFCLEDSTGPDAGPFARRPEQLRELFNEV